VSGVHLGLITNDAFADIHQTWATTSDGCLLEAHVSTSLSEKRWRANAAGGPRQPPRLLHIGPG
jgi:hypothetical protein